MRVEFLFVGGIAPRGLSCAFRAYRSGALWRRNTGCFHGLGYFVSRFRGRGMAGCDFYHHSALGEQPHRGGHVFSSGEHSQARPSVLGRSRASRGLTGGLRDVRRGRIAQNCLSDTPLCAVTGPGVGRPPHGPTPRAASQNLAAPCAEMFRLSHSFRPQSVGAILYMVCLTAQAQNLQLLGFDRVCASFLCGDIFSRS